jgi:hexosaminidase
MPAEIFKHLQAAGRACLMILLMLPTAYLNAQDACPVIPLPQQAIKEPGAFTLGEGAGILCRNAGMLPIAHYLQQEMLRQYQLTLPVSPVKAARSIAFVYDSKWRGPSGAYGLQVFADRVVITARDNEGLFYGAVSLLQLVRTNEKGHPSPAIACWQLRDEPLYEWRGLMLDESRHFFGKEKVKQLLDWMAFYKLNRFHWHLTDQPGWRLEIKQYPRLATVGGIGNYSNEQAPAAWYPQSDIREIVAYAAARFITIIPEIDMPGHATAANRAYPAFSGGGSEKFPDFTFNPGNEGTYQYITNILKETDVLFPSGMIHIGGDEVHFGNGQWKSDTGVQQLMKRAGLKDLQAVERYFTERIADSLLRISNKVLVWDEAADFSLRADSTILFWWRHNKPEQLQKAINRLIPVVLCPRLPFYFDYMQDSVQVHGPDWRKFGLNSTRAVYLFKREELPVVFGDHARVLGIQANIWTERIVSPQRLDYMLFPRIAALSEAAWTAPAQRNYDQFLTRLAPHLPLYAKDGLYYFNLPAPAQTGEPRE